MENLDVATVRRFDIAGKTSRLLSMSFLRSLENFVKFAREAKKYYQQDSEGDISSFVEMLEAEQALFKKVWARLSEDEQAAPSRIAQKLDQMDL